MLEMVRMCASDREASVGSMYLLPAINLRLRPRLLTDLRDQGQGDAGSSAKQKRVKSRLAG